MIAPTEPMRPGGPSFNASFSPTTCACHRQPVKQTPKPIAATARVRTCATPPCLFIYYIHLPPFDGVHEDLQCMPRSRAALHRCLRVCLSLRSVCLMLLVCRARNRLLRWLRKKISPPPYEKRKLLRPLIWDAQLNNGRQVN